MLTGGRFELGLGAGWHREEYEEVGIPFDPPAVRAARLEEAVEVVRDLLDGEEVVHDGDHYRLRRLKGTPEPEQERIPLLVGGGGPRLLRLAAREADIVGIAPRSLPDGGIDVDDLTADAMDRKVDWIDEELEAVGRAASGGPERNVLLQAVRPTVDDDAMRASPHVLVGETSEMAYTALERRERWGISYLVCFERDLERFAPVVARLRAEGEAGTHR